MEKQATNSTKQLKMNFESGNKNVKVISINRTQNKDLTARILNRKRTSL